MGKGYATLISMLITYFILGCASFQKPVSASTTTIAKTTTVPEPAGPITNTSTSTTQKLTRPQVNLNDVHFHLTNYVQRGISMKSAIAIMNAHGVGRASVFGIPLQQKWNMRDNIAPTYYLHDDNEMYYYSAVDFMIAREYLSLAFEEQSRIDPMITGFNPTDGHAVDHIRNVLKLYPGVFSGIGEFSVKKEFVSSKIAGSTAMINDPALNNILDFAGETGLLVILHCDIDAVISNNKTQPTYLSELEKLFSRSKKTTIIWAHTGLGRFVKQRADHTLYIEQLAQNHSNLYFDISWDLVAQQVNQDQGTLARWTALFQKFPKRFLFGSDTVSPTNVKYKRNLAVYQPIWDSLPTRVSELIQKGNYERLYDLANKKVRTWEQANITDLSPEIHFPYIK